MALRSRLTTLVTILSSFLTFVSLLSFASEEGAVLGLIAFVGLMSTFSFSWSSALLSFCFGLLTLIPSFEARVAFILAPIASSFACVALTGLTMLFASPLCLVFSFSFSFAFPLA